MELHVNLVSELMFGHRRIIFGNGTEPVIFFPKLLSNMTKTLIGYIIIRDDTSSKQWNRK